MSCGASVADTAFITETFAASLGQRVSQAKADVFHTLNVCCVDDVKPHRIDYHLPPLALLH